MYVTCRYIYLLDGLHSTHSDDENGDRVSLPASSATQVEHATHSCHTPNNLDILATVASTALLPPAPPIPARSPSNNPTTTSSAARTSKRKAAQTDYADLDENGDVDPPTPKRRRPVKKGGKGASNGKGANQTKVGSGAGPGSKPPARPKRTTTAPTT